MALHKVVLALNGKNYKENVIISYSLVPAFWNHIDFQDRKNVFDVKLKNNIIKVAVNT